MGAGFQSRFPLGFVIILCSSLNSCVEELGVALMSDEKVAERARSGHAVMFGGGGSGSPSRSRGYSPPKETYTKSELDGLATYSDLFSITKDGSLISNDERARVLHQPSSRFTHPRGWKKGEARAIIYHLTAGRTCGKKHHIDPKYRRPHLYICRDGTIITNGPMNHPRTGAEAAHNSYTFNIEFEAAYAKKGQSYFEGGGHIYEPLSTAQLKVGRELSKVLSEHFGIPLEPVIPAANNAETYYDYDTYVSASSSGIRGRGIHSSRAHGVMPSVWTRKQYKDSSNHDDGPTFEEFEHLRGGAPLFS